MCLGEPTLCQGAALWGDRALCVPWGCRWHLVSRCPMCLAVPCCRADAAGRQVTGDTTAAPLGAPTSSVLIGVPWGAGDPQRGAGWRCTIPSSCPGGLCTGAEREAPAAKSLLGQPGECPGGLGAGAGRGLRGLLGRSVGDVGGTRVPIPALPGRRLWCVLGTRHHQQEQVWPARGSA